MTKAAKTSISREQLCGYLDDSLCDTETARVEDALRHSESLRKDLRSLMQERDRGEHSVGAIWRRSRLTCPNREQLGSFLLGVLDAGFHGYVEFHLKTVGCAFCLANLADLEEQRREAAPHTHQRRKRYFESSAGLLRGKR
ncbi:MAG: hypothetical protein HY040_12375 [Planctomycetes bacterium]|nr:hypothetical protein [Planctomycetota bacterium]